MCGLGDCNNDGITNATDVLFIGLRYNQSGPARASQGCAWEAKCATAWATPNAVYADANGNGTVNAADVLCIGLNYNKTHTAAPANRHAATKLPFAMRMHPCSIINCLICATVPWTLPICKPAKNFM
ncbi:MAG: dockerin type I domain-containing protein [Calditrichia bacterium]